MTYNVFNGTLNLSQSNVTNRRQTDRHAATASRSETTTKFRVSRRRREMYCGHARLCVCSRPHAHTIARNRL